MAVYRDDHQAAIEKVASLEAELAEARQRRDADKARISRLQADLSASQSSLARIRSEMGMPYMPSLPSNATMVIVVGILGIAMCQIFGPVAWAMANRELEQIAYGTADPSKRGIVVAGKVLGIIATLMLVLSGLLMVFAVLAGGH